MLEFVNATVKLRRYTSNLEDEAIVRGVRHHGYFPLAVQDVELVVFEGSIFPLEHIND